MCRPSTETSRESAKLCCPQLRQSFPFRAMISSKLSSGIGSEGNQSRMIRPPLECGQLQRRCGLEWARVRGTSNHLESTREPYLLRSFLCRIPSMPEETFLDRHLVECQSFSPHLEINSLDASSIRHKFLNVKTFYGNSSEF